MVSTGLALGITAAVVLAFTAVGLLASRGRVSTLEDYISARESAGPGALTATVVASMMGAWILFSPAEAGAVFGGLPAILGYAIGSALPLLLFIPVGMRLRALMPAGHSLTEFAYVRFGRGMSVFVLLVSILYMFVFLAAELTGIATAFSLVAGIPTWQTALLIGGFVMVYTVYGGLIASIVTDKVQALVVLPLLAVAFAGALFALGGTSFLHARALEAEPTLLDPAFYPGVEFGIYVAVAILGANMLNQGLWQRVYAADGPAALRRGFAVAAIAVVPMVLLAGLFGIAAAALELTGPETASIAFFLVLTEAFPDWVTLLVVVLAVLLVMSSADTMFNAIASVATADLARILEDTEPRTLWMVSRASTILVAIGAIVIGAQGYSVLELFLAADLLAAAVFIPFLAGLYTARLSGPIAVLASVMGMAVGFAYFPLVRGVLGGIEGFLPAPSFLFAFLGAAGVAGLITLLGIAIGDGEADLGQLDREIRRLGPATPAEEAE